MLKCWVSVSLQAFPGRGRIPLSAVHLFLYRAVGTAEGRRFHAWCGGRTDCAIAVMAANEVACVHYPCWWCVGY